VAQGLKGTCVKRLAIALMTGHMMHVGRWYKDTCAYTILTPRMSRQVAFADGSPASIV
jgi:hypothetical protein